MSLNGLRLGGVTHLNRGAKNIFRNKYGTNMYTYSRSFGRPSPKARVQGNRKTCFDKRPPLGSSDCCVTRRSREFQGFVFSKPKKPCIEQVKTEPKRGPISQDGLRLRGPTLLDRGVQNLSRNKYPKYICSYFRSFDLPNPKVWGPGETQNHFLKSDPFWVQ